jgi:MFS family permease
VGAAVIETLLFLSVAVALYFLADWLLNAIEARLGRRLGHRSVAFFAILLASALAVFALIRAFAPT